MCSLLLSSAVGLVENGRISLGVTKCQPQIQVHTHSRWAMHFQMGPHTRARANDVSTTRRFYDAEARCARKSVPILITGKNKPLRTFDLIVWCYVIWFRCIFSPFMMHWFDSIWFRCVAFRSISSHLHFLNDYLFIWFLEKLLFEFYFNHLIRFDWNFFVFLHSNFFYLLVNYFIDSIF